MIKEAVLTKNQEVLLTSLRKACKKIAPVWSLENFVAVNPYLGLTDKKFDSVAYNLAMLGGIQMTLPTAFYLKKLKEGKILEEDITNTLKYRKQNIDFDSFIKNIDNKSSYNETRNTVASFTDIATQKTNKDWNRFMTERISTWAASYFDKGQAMWSAANKLDALFKAWKFEAQIDLTTELSGLKGFRKTVKSFPDNPIEAIQKALDILDIPEEDLELYLHRLLLKMGGWSAYAARLDWENELYGKKDGKLIAFLAVLVCWEACIYKSLQNDDLDKDWKKAKKVLNNTAILDKYNPELEKKIILQEAFERATQRQVINKFKGQLNSKPAKDNQPKAQAIFCIDVRSEVYRRNLELIDNEIETIGFAGFFGFPINYVPIAHQVGEAQCPALIPTGPTIMEQFSDEKVHQKTFNKRTLNRQLQQVWKSFKSGSVSCFSFVSPLGLSYLPKLFTDSFGLTRPVPHPDKVGLKKQVSSHKTINLSSSEFKNENAGIPIAQQTQMAKNALKAMSLSDNFAKFILIVGHGATTVNNPHATGYDCGACGGHSGEANAKVAAAVLNNKTVRANLKNENITIPENTVFLACLHDTTTDELIIYNDYDVVAEKKAALNNLKQSLLLAGQASRTERAFRLSVNDTKNIDKSVIYRSKDWSQTRPEWGLAGCDTFIVAPRYRTKDINFEGKSFLHSYDWKKDVNFSVLELIMTAPLVVTSWINLQYYGSTVDNKNYGSGNKTLHNITAGIGVLEGFSGDLRVGLPFQSIHDGTQYQHEPLKLNVIIEAPIEAMNAILKKHKTVRDLCDNGWLHLLALDENGEISHRYKGQLHWELVTLKAA